MRPQWIPDAGRRARPELSPQLYNVTRRGALSDWDKWVRREICNLDPRTRGIFGYTMDCGLFVSNLH
jgi:hypothetical protein